MKFPHDLEAVPRNPEAEKNYTPMPLGLTDKAKAMRPDWCPYCENGLLKEGQSGKDFGGCPAFSFRLAHNTDGGWIIEADIQNGEDLYGESQSVFGESSPVNACPMCRGKLA